MEEKTESEAAECSLSNGAAIDVDAAGKHVIDVVTTVDYLTESMRKELASKVYKPDYLPTIFRVPEEMRNDDPGAYSPMVVSIGPFHRSGQNVQHIEVLKWHYLGNFLDRRPENDLQMYVEEMRKLEKGARSCYKGNVEIAESEEFVRMMVLDGCFIIQLLLQSEDGFALKDPIYCDRWTLPRVAHDMLLLENQLPFFVLERLWKLTPRNGPSDDLSIKRSVLNFFRNLLPEEHDLEPTPTAVHHILHLLHSSLTRRSLMSIHKPPPKPRRFPMFGHKPQPMSEHKPPPPPETIPTVTELQDAGVKFKRKKAKSFFEIEFKQGLMEIPRLTISNTTNSLFRNFIAFEQCLPWSSSHFTSYCIFMDSLINTPRDVQLLHQSDIIKHVLGSDKEVAILFNKLCKGITWDYRNSYLARNLDEVCAEFLKRSELKWPKWRATLVRDYFSNPWAILSLAAAIYVIIIASGQTFFAVLAYFSPPRS